MDFLLIQWEKQYPVENIFRYYINYIIKFITTVWEQINLVPPAIMLRKKHNFCGISAKNTLLESHPKKMSDKFKKYDSLENEKLLTLKNFSMMKKKRWEDNPD